MWSHIAEDIISHSQCYENLICHNHDDGHQSCVLHGEIQSVFVPSFISFSPQYATWFNT
jgi:hypothetical protein